MSFSFVQQLALAALIFVPLERFCGVDRNRKLLREGLLLDLTHLFATGAIITVGVSLLLLLTIVQLAEVVPSGWRSAVASQPTAVQLVEILLIADLGFYLAHRAFHAFPFLWRFHVVHHSIEQLDWIAAHRVHPVDQIMTRGISLIPVFAIGFETPAIAAFAIMYHWQSLLIHSNARIRFGPFRWLLASPQFHHWHHANQREAFDKNFAGQLPLWDVIFGTAFMPAAEMPKCYGTKDPVPKSYVGQIAYPFLSSRRSPSDDLSRPIPSLQSGQAAQIEGCATRDSSA